MATAELATVQRATAPAIWRRLFEHRAPLRYELLLVYLLVFKVVKESIWQLRQTRETFYAQDAFKPFVLGVDPIGWADCLPVSWVTSYGFHQLVATIALTSAALWFFKRCLPWSAIVATWLFGLSNCLRQSLDFDYIHQNLPPVAAMIVLAATYTFRRREISRALREGRFWETDFYREWVIWVLLVYMGLLYSYSGIWKLAYGGWDAGNGVKLQLIIDALAPDGPLSRPILQYRPLATLLMTGTVILETGALPGLLIPRLRPWWAISLVMMHLMIGISMGIWFVPSMVILTWLAFRVDRLPFAQLFCRIFAWPRMAAIPEQSP
jgi:hypothetical protein